MVKGVWPKLKKIFRMRMRSSTFPVLSCADLGRVMRDLGMIQVKECYQKLKVVWEQEMAN
jgi:hypothetical protein